MGGLSLVIKEVAIYDWKKKIEFEVVLLITKILRDLLFCLFV